MTQHTDKYVQLTRRSVRGHKKGDVFEITAEKGLIGIWVKTGLIKAYHESGDAGTEEG